MGKSRVSWYLGHPLTIFTRIATMFPTIIKSDKLFINLFYYTAFAKLPDLKNPQTFNEKLQWLKLYNRKPEYIKMVDKCDAKKYVASIIGEDHIIPTLGVYNNVDEIDFDTLPKQFVLKCTHDSGGLVICKDKDELDIESAKEKLHRNFSENIFWRTREWPYKNIKPRVIAEKYLIDESGIELKDYKFFCFNGICKFFKIDFNRYVEHHANYYDRDLKLLPFGENACPPIFNKSLFIPDNINEMIRLAEVVANENPFVRVDFYNVNGRIYFGEITFFPDSGVGVLNPIEWDAKIGSYINLPSEKIAAE